MREHRWHRPSFPSLKYTRNSSAAEALPGPRWGSLQRSPRLSSWIKGGKGNKVGKGAVPLRRRRGAHLPHRGTIGVNNLPRVVARQCTGRESNSRPSDHKSDALAITLPSHHKGIRRNRNWERKEARGKGGEEKRERRRNGEGKGKGSDPTNFREKLTPLSAITSEDK